MKAFTKTLELHDMSARPPSDFEEEWVVQSNGRFLRPIDLVPTGEKEVRGKLIISVVLLTDWETSE